MRAGDSDRQSVVDRLTTHFTDGRLDPNEYDARVQKAYAAAYLDEFAVLFEDLPEPKQPSVQDDWSGFGRPGSAGALFGRGGGCGGSGRSAMGTGTGHPPFSSWSGRPPMPRPPSVLGLVLFVAGVFFLLTMLTGFVFFGFPFMWIGLMVFFIVRGGARRRRWEGHQRGWDRSGRGRY